MGIRTAAALCAIVACMQSPTFAAKCADLQPLKRPVRIIVPTVPGGSSDFLTRLMATWLGDCWGQSVVVENRAGASGMIALDGLARAVPDGNTFALFNVTYLLAASLSGKHSLSAAAISLASRAPRTARYCLSFTGTCLRNR